MGRRMKMAEKLEVTERLKLFVEVAEALRNTAIVRNGFEAILNPDEGDFCALLLSFRHFFAEGSPIMLTKVLGVARGLAPDQETREKLRKIGKLWGKSLSSAPVRIKIDEEILTPRQLITMYFNGHYFHRVPGERARIKKLSPKDFPFTEDQFRVAFVPLTQLILQTSELIKDRFKDLFKDEAVVEQEPTNWYGSASSSADSGE